jgi:uncharacterized protein (TIGR03066 family)
VSDTISGERSIRMSAARFVLGGLCILAVAFLATAGEDYGNKIVGKWDTKAKGKKLGATIEFTKDGKMQIRFDAGGNVIEINGTYKVDKDKLAMTLDAGDKKKTDTSTIKKVTDKELHLEDATGKLSVYKRLE